MEKENSSKNNQIPSGTTPRSNPKKCISKKDLTNLDEFIQNCLDKFKFIDPKEEFYEATGDEKDLIISHKSTIPDLVIWNKVFNKNECFIESNNKKMNSFPRFQFYLRIKSNKFNYSLSFLLRARQAPAIARPDTMIAEIPITEPQP